MEWGGNVCIIVADSQCHIAETNTTLQKLKQQAKKNMKKEYKYINTYLHKYM